MVLRAARPYDPSPSKVTVDFTVRNGQVEATVRPAAPNTYTPTWALFRFDHETMNVREIPLELPDSLSDGESRTIRVEALAGSRITADAAAPDGYSLNTSSSGGTGLVGDIFGMSRYRRNLSLINRGRMVPLELPSPFQDPYASEVFGVGWVIGPAQGS